MDAQKYSAISDAKTMARSLQRSLMHFRVQLSHIPETPIKPHASSGLETPSFFLDAFLDGLLFDLNSLNTINQSLGKVSRAAGKVHAILISLRKRQEFIEREIALLHHDYAGISGGFEIPGAALGEKLAKRKV